MTTNQTIDGVPGLRELLERLYAEHVSIAGPGFWVAWKELRALLDKEVSGDSRAPLPQGEPVALSADELKFLEAIAMNPGAKLNDSIASSEEGNSLWVRLEDLGLIECIGSYKWKLTFNAVELGVKAFLGQQPAPVAVVPDGYCIMPRQLTAENGAKALLLGEFKLLVTKECPECCELEEPTEGCSICDGEGEYGQKHTIPWDQIKCIYSKAISGLAVKTQLATSR